MGACLVHAGVGCSFGDVDVAHCFVADKMSKSQIHMGTPYSQ